MKNIKRVKCSGLAFGDKEDMEILHKYALEGWIFREFKGITYILHKEEPQDIIFSYDFCNLKKENESEYYELFKSAGWEPVEFKDKSIHFFHAKNGTVPVHTDSDIQADQFGNIAKWSLVALILSVLVLIASMQFNNLSGIYSVLQILTIVFSAAVMGGSAMCFTGCFLRTRKRRLVFNISFKTNILLLIFFILAFIVLHFVPDNFSDPFGSILDFIAGLSFGGIIAMIIALFFKYPLYRDGKEK